MPWSPTAVHADGATPVHAQIRRAINDAVRSGALGQGERLPAVRPLASTLGVNRLTVLKAIRALTRAGVLTTVKGKGVFVAADAEPGAPAGERGATGYEGPFFEGLAEGPPSAPRGGEARETAFHAAVSDAQREDLVMFSAGVPPREAVPARAIRRQLSLLLREPDGAGRLGYAATEGEGAFREALVALLAGRGVRLGPDDTLLVTGGAQQGIALCLDVLLRGGGVVAVESPGYMGTIAACRLRGIPMVSVPVDRGGINPARLEQALRRSEVRAVYTVPTYQNPTGITQSRRRRERLLAIAARHDVVVIEDDTYGDLRLGGRSIAPMRALPGGERVVYLGSFSKSLAPGLRVGFLVASGALGAELRYLKESIDISSGSLAQMVVGEMLRTGQYGRHLARVRRMLRPRRDAMLAALERYFPPWARYTRPKGGLHLWVMFDRRIDSERLLVRAREAGVTFSPGPLFFCDGRKPGCLRLNFAAQPEERIEYGIKRLARCIEEETR